MFSNLAPLWSDCLHFAKTKEQLASGVEGHENYAPVHRPNNASRPSRSRTASAATERMGAENAATILIKCNFARL